MRSLDSPEDNLEGALLHPAASLSDKALTALLPTFAPLLRLRT